MAVSWLTVSDPPNATHAAWGRRLPKRGEGHGLVEAGICVALIFFAIGGIVNWLRGHRHATAARAHAALVARSQERGIERSQHPEVFTSKWDYVLVFPLRGEASSYLHFAGSHVMHLNWDSEVDGVQLASAVFRNPSRPHLVSEEEIQQRFSARMTLEEYHEQVTALLTKILAGPDFGLELESFPSIDHDEIFLKMRFPAGHQTLAQYAAHFGYVMPLSDAAYKNLDMDVPLDSYGREVRATAQFDPEKSEYFQGFRQVDRIRLLRARVGRYFDLDLLVQQHILAEHFAVHHWDQVVAMCDGWANPWLWYQLPERRYEDVVRDYFGEEISWIFVWQACYSRALIFPACFGGLLFFRRYFVTMYAEHILTISFAVLLSFWATVFIRHYERYEAVLRQRWEMDLFHPPVVTRAEYRPQHENFKIRCLWMGVGDLVAFCMMCIDIVGMQCIQQFRQKMQENDQDNHWFWFRIAALLISFQIYIIDIVWLKISSWLVSRENHKTQKAWDESLVRKIFGVRVFNNFYPFLYVGFLKQYTEGCPATKAGCLQELELYLIVYFGFFISSSLLQDLYLIIIARMQVYAELRKHSSHDKSCDYLQIQSKAPPNDRAILVDDWTNSVMAYAFMLSFSVVMPAVVLVALLTNLFQSRCMAHRNVCLLQRPKPTAAKGIGVWLSLLYIVDVVAVIVVCSLACFTMQPLRDFDTKTKYIVFVAAQYVIFLVKGYISGIYFPIPEEVAELRLASEETVRRSFLNVESHPVVATPVMEVLPEIGPRAFAGPAETIPMTPARHVAQAAGWVHSQTSSLLASKSLSLSGKTSLGKSGSRVNTLLPREGDESETSP
jgi:hypothetical protein